MIQGSHCSVDLVSQEWQAFVLLFFSYDLSMRTAWIAAVVVFSSHYIRSTCQHSFYTSDLPKVEGLSIFSEHASPQALSFSNKSFIDHDINSFGV